MSSHSPTRIAVLASAIVLGLAGPLQAEVYENTLHGFRITGPDAWSKREGPPSGNQPIVYMERNGTSASVIGVTVDPLPNDSTISSAVDFSNTVLSDFQNKSSKLVIVEAPHQVELNGLTGSRFIMDLPGTHPTGEVAALRVLMIQFLRSKEIVSLVITATPEVFTQRQELFKEVIGSFRLTDPLPVEATSFNLREISSEKIKELQNHFTPHLRGYPLKFTDEIMARRVRMEAHEVFGWLRNKANWPEPPSYDLLLNVAALSSSFHLLDMPGAPDFAVRTYERAIALDPHRYEAYLALAQLHASSGHGEETVKNALAASQRSDEAIDKGALKLLAMGFYFSGRVQEASDAITRHLQRHPGDETGLALQRTYEAVQQRLRLEDRTVPEKLEFEVIDQSDPRTSETSR